MLKNYFKIFWIDHRKKSAHRIMTLKSPSIFKYMSAHLQIRLESLTRLPNGRVVDLLLAIEDWPWSEYFTLLRLKWHFVPTALAGAALLRTPVISSSFYMIPYVLDHPSSHKSRNASQVSTLVSHAVSPRILNHNHGVTTWGVGKSKDQGTGRHYTYELDPVARISKNHCAGNSGSPEVELSFCPWLTLFKYWTGWPDLSSSLCPYYVYA